MQDQMQVRLEALKQEFDRGQAEVRRLEKQQSQLRDTLLRISGAMQVLEELLAEGQGGKPGATNGTGPLERARIQTEGSVDAKQSLALDRTR
jgi:ABC-type transporter Mla subunit MlaD